MHHQGQTIARADLGSEEKSENNDAMRLDFPPVDATSEIRAEVQAAYVAAKEEDAMIEQQLETLSKTVDDPLAVLFDDPVEEESTVTNNTATEVHGSTSLDDENTEMVDEEGASENADDLETFEWDGGCPNGEGQA